MVSVIIPPLVLCLEYFEEQKGFPLTEEEVLKARDDAPAIEMEEADFVAWTKTRGPDLDPAHVWEQWQRYRETGELSYPGEVNDGL